MVKFLGQVNPFHGRLEDGKVHFADMSMDSPEHAATPSRPVRVFIRPHDIEVDTQRNGHPCFRAVVTRIHSAGANVRVELLADSGERLHAELTQERYRGAAHHDRQPGLRHAPRGEGLLQRRVRAAAAPSAAGFTSPPP